MLNFTKLLFALAIALVSLMAGLTPLYAKSNEKLFNLGESLVCGIFLGTALFHMLPDAWHLFRLSLPEYSYPLPMLLTVLGFGFLFILQRLSQKNMNSAAIVLIVLSLHSVIGGLALGLATPLANAIIIFIAIITHKAFDSFALIISLNKHHTSHGKMIFWGLVFSLFTPLGILLGCELNTLLQSQQALIWQASFNAIAAGTFIYIAIFEMMTHDIPTRTTRSASNLALIALGMSIMGLIAFWV